MGVGEGEGLRIRGERARDLQYGRSGALRCEDERGAATAADDVQGSTRQYTATADALFFFLFLVLFLEGEPKRRR